MCTRKVSLWVSCALLSVSIGTSAAFAAPGSGRSSWPSLEQQLAEAGAPSGSALERLIRENQRFTLLAQSEVNDDLGLPPWIRVLWRRSRPVSAAFAGDPAGRYPLALKEVYRWMVQHPDLESGEATRPISMPDGSRATPGPNLKVNLATVGRSESDIRINPLAPNQVIAAANYNDGGVGGGQAQFFSADGGATWGDSALPLIGTDFQHADPGVDWTSDGRAWATTIGVADPGALKLRVRAYVSTDGGATWSFDGSPSGAQTDTDKVLLWADSSSTSAFRDTLYACWRSVGSTATFVSRRTGAGWAAPIKVSGKETKSAAVGCHVTTNAAGDAFVFWTSTGSSKVHYAKSTNGGASWGAPGTVATTYDNFNIGIPAMASRRTLIYVASGSYRSGSLNNVYTSWTDLSGEGTCTSPAREPGTNVASTCKTRIWFARSTNGGSTWSAKVKLNAPASLNDQFNHWLAVDPTNGKIGVMYYDTVADAGRKKTHVYYQSSADHGVTWSAPVAVTTAQTDETVAGANTVDQYGDYNGMAAFLTKFLPIWTDRRSGGAEEIWTAPVDDP